MKAPIGKRSAIQRAKEIYEEYSRRLGCSVTVEKLAEALHIEVLVHALPDDDSGLLLVKDKKALVIVNKNHSEGRRRFSLAHEIAHYLLHADDSHEIFHRDRRSSLGTSRIEVEANAFAAEILMPEDEIKTWVESELLDLLDEEMEEKVAEKAKQLSVSTQALGIRLERLGLLSNDFFV